MYRESITVPCAIIRGGTSKGIFFLENDIPLLQAGWIRMLIIHMVKLV